ncbi:MAG: F0F1 ATP synthase subunit B [Candidatus Omnitrophota bacterium]|nr:F0F1 ATP synthase subunit B [Candidatus Omnitrophota bacterium]
MNETLNVAQPLHHPEEAPNTLLAPDAALLLLTWITFFTLLVVLYKSTWKPILTALEKREAMIRKAVDDAEDAKNQLAKINETREQLIKEADLEAREIVEASRKAAVETAKVIEHKAKEQAQITLENAQREIKEGKEKLVADLRRESVQVAVQLAEKILEENLNNEKNNKIIDQFIKNL